MNEENPYESPSHQSDSESNSNSWRLLDFLAIGLWLAIPIGVYIARLQLKEVYEEYGIHLPYATLFLLSTYSTILFVVVPLIVLLGLISIPHGNFRRGLTWLALVTGCLVVVVCLLSFLAPFYALWQGLTA